MRKVSIAQIQFMKAKKPREVEQDPQETIKKIGRKMARLRKELGYGNADDFCYDNGLNRSQYGKYEAGTKDIRISSLTNVVNKLGMTLEEFFGEGLDWYVQIFFRANGSRERHLTSLI